MIFLDTNVLVYAIDFRDKRKQIIAECIIEDALRGINEYSLAVQTLSEFANVALLKLMKSPEDVREFLQAYMDIPTISPDGAMVLRGIEIKHAYGIQFYDAMMIAAAERAGANTILSEDLNDGQIYCGIKAENPFK